MRDWRPLVVPLVLLLAWELATALRLHDFEFISQPTKILAAGFVGITNGTFFVATLQTLEACVFGLSLALVVGVLLGIFLGLSSFAELVSRPCLEGLRSIPSIAFAPLTLLLFGFGLPMEGLVVAYSCLWPILITTIAATRNVEQRLIEFSATLEMTRRDMVRKIMVPAILSRVLVGLRTAAGFALVVSVTVEILINPRGLGYGLIIAQQSLQIDLMYAYLVWLAFVGFCINALIRLVDRDEAARVKESLTRGFGHLRRRFPAVADMAERVLPAIGRWNSLAATCASGRLHLPRSTHREQASRLTSIASVWRAAKGATEHLSKEFVLSIRSAADRSARLFGKTAAAAKSVSSAASASVTTAAAPLWSIVRPSDRELRRKLGEGIAVVSFTLLFFALWQAIVDFGIVSRIFVAAPLSALDVISERLSNCSLPRTVWTTGQRLLAGWLSAVVVALALGTLIGNSRRAYAYLSPTLEFFRPLPASAVIPVAALFLGLTATMSTFVVAFGALWPVLLAAMHGFANVPRELREVADTLEMSRGRYIATVALPSASVDIMAGLRISLSLALILTVVTEMQASLPGLGYEIFAAQRNFRSADLYAGLMTLGVFGYVVNHALLVAERRMMRWRAA